LTSPVDVDPSRPPQLRSFPWPPLRRGEGLEAFAWTIRRAALEPVRFFDAMPARAAHGPPLAFYVLVGTLAVGFTLFWSGFYRSLGVDPGSGTLRYLLWGARDPVGLADFILAPIILTVALFVAGAIFHASLRLLGGPRGYRTTTHVFAYAAAPSVLAIAGGLGDLAGTVWSLVLMVAGLAAAHRTARWRAALAVALPVAALAVLAVAAALLGGVASLLDGLP
jgi:hypothetical protein